MTISIASALLANICVEQNLHPTETLNWVKLQTREGQWKGLNPHSVVLEAQRELSSTGAYL